MLYSAIGPLCGLLFGRGKRNNLPALIGQNPSVGIVSDFLRYVVLNDFCHSYHSQPHSQRT